MEFQAVSLVHFPEKWPYFGNYYHKKNGADDVMGQIKGAKFLPPGLGNPSKL